MSVAIFSSRDDDCIERKVETCNRNRTAPSEVECVYRIDDSIKWIEAGGYGRIALQFPDELMGDAVLVAEKIGACVEGTVFILGDTAYGSCCVDEIAAEHNKADCILHFGRACLSPTRRLPVLYVFGRLPLEICDCVDRFQELFIEKDTKVIIMYDTVYCYAIGELKKCLESSEYTHLVVSELSFPSDQVSSQQGTSDLDKNSGDAQTICKCGRTIKLPANTSLENYSIFYIGDESRTLTNMIMTFNKCQFSSYNPMTRTARKESLNINKALMKRFYLIEKAKDAEIVGIVVGTLGVSKYVEIINQLKKVIKSAGKKSYTLVVGKLNVPKLANFMEVDIFVYVTCPENTLLDSSEFYKPVVSPYEMEVACNRSRVWTGDVITDFSQLLPGGASYVEMFQDDSCEESDVSLITGKLRTVGQRDDKEMGAMLKRSDLWTVSVQQSGSAGEFLAGRSWQGLKQDVGQTPVELAIEGARGIAIGYAGEGEAQGSLQGTARVAIKYEEENKENG